MAKKNAFLFPDINKKIRALLLDFEDNGQGKRVRTDVDGSASISGFKKGNYYVVYLWNYSSDYIINILSNFDDFKFNVD